MNPQHRVILTETGIQDHSIPIYPRNCRNIIARFLGIIDLSRKLFFSLVFLLSITSADAGQIPAELIQRNAPVQAAGLAVSAKSLIPKIQNGGKVLLIDIRSAPDYAALHIPGAMNIPLHFIKTKPYLKSAPIVLVDQGLSLHRLAPACRELRKQGFDARILDGGMNSWSKSGGPMVGEPVRQMAYSRITPADFFLEKNDTRRIVCDVSAMRSPASMQLMTYAMHLPLTGSTDSRVAKLKNSRRPMPVVKP